jgi:hypothetical protein
MENLFGYTVIKKISENDGSIEYRGMKKGRNGTVIIKIIKTGSPSPTEIARFKLEYEAIKKIDIEGIIQTYDIYT